VTKPALIPIEGPEKATRGGGEWEPIKIPRRNLAYIPKMTRRPSLPTGPVRRSLQLALLRSCWPSPHLPAIFGSQHLHLLILIQFCHLRRLSRRVYEAFNYGKPESRSNTPTFVLQKNLSFVGMVIIKINVWPYALCNTAELHTCPNANVCTNLKNYKRSEYCEMRRYLTLVLMH
jgi:hypothetical protein